MDENVVRHLYATLEMLKERHSALPAKFTIVGRFEGGTEDSVYIVGNDVELASVARAINDLVERQGKSE